MTLQSSTGFYPVIAADQLIEDAARRAFSDLAEKYYANAGDQPDKNLTLRRQLLASIDELGFCDVLADADNPNAWADAGAIIRAQARAAAPIDMVGILVDKDQQQAISAEPGHYSATISGKDSSQTIASQTKGLGRCLQMTGCMDAALDISLQYVQDRQQFGRSLAAFQAVQHSLAIAAEETAAATAITDLCLATLVQHGHGARLTSLLDAAAVVNNGAASVVYDVVHQVHGAIGFTQEYPLHRHTLNLFGWRDDMNRLLGGDIACAERIGQQVNGHDSVWATVTHLMTPEQ